MTWPPTKPTHYCPKCGLTYALPTPLPVGVAAGCQMCTKKNHFTHKLEGVMLVEFEPEVLS